MIAWPRMVRGPSKPSSSSQAIGVFPWRASISLNSTTDWEAWSVIGQPRSSAACLASRRSSGVQVSTWAGRKQPRTRSPWAPSCRSMELRWPAQALRGPRSSSHSHATRRPSAREPPARSGRSGPCRRGGRSARRARRRARPAGRSPARSSRRRGAARPSRSRRRRGSPSSSWAPSRTGRISNSPE